MDAKGRFTKEMKKLVVKDKKRDKRPNSNPITAMRNALRKGKDTNV